MLTDLQTKKWTHLFNIYDANNSGIVNKEDYEIKAKAVAKTLNLKVESPEYKQMYAEIMADWEQVRKNMDSNENNEISLDEWLAHASTRITDTDMYQNNKAEADTIFSLFDQNGDSSISREEYCTMLKAWGVDEKELDFICSKLNLQEDKVLSKDKFIEFLEQFHKSDDPDLPGNYMFGSF